MECRRRRLICLRASPLRTSRLPIADQQFPVDPSLIERGLDYAANSFGTTFWVAFALVLLTFIPAAFLPRRRERSHLLDDQQGEQGKTPVVIH